MDMFDTHVETHVEAATPVLPERVAKRAPGQRSGRLNRRGVADARAVKLVATEVLDPLGQPFDVALVGLGYVGLPTALAFHSAGRSVLGLDVSESRRRDIMEDRADLLESDHVRLRTALLDPGRFTLGDDASRLRDARAVIIAVPTPVDDHLIPDLTILRDACARVVEHAVAGQVLILTSTTYVGSTDDLLVAPLLARGFTVGEDIYVAFSPERIDPGNERHTHEDVPRVVGGVTPACTAAASAALAAYAANLHSVSSPGAAEMTKLFENTFRAVNIALANELADLCRTLRLDVIEVVEAAATKPYGFMPFYPGPGVGGHCIPCDPHYLLWQLRSRRQPAPMIEQAMASIAGQPAHVVDRVREVLSLNGRGTTGARVLILGVSYKPDVEDVRQSPALEIIEGLLRVGAQVEFHDPLVPVIRLRDGSSLASLHRPDTSEADIVVVHTLHTDLDIDWLEDAPLILDASYRLRDFPQRFAL
jgi:UDP-N-acetyl-D-glucosamine dehydrogenase